MVVSFGPATSSGLVGAACEMWDVAGAGAGNDDSLSLASPLQPPANQPVSLSPCTDPPFLTETPLFFSFWSMGTAWSSTSLILLVSSEQFEKFVRSAREKLWGALVLRLYIFFCMFLLDFGLILFSILFYFRVPVSLWACEPRNPIAVDFLRNFLLLFVVIWLGLVWFGLAAQAKGLLVWMKDQAASSKDEGPKT